jgi:hypothetical protein
MSFWSVQPGRGLAAAVVVGALALGVTPVSIAYGHAAHGHPAKIHNGSCKDLKGVAFDLNGIGAEVDVDGNPVPAQTAVNEDAAYQVLLSRTPLQATLDDLLAEPRAIMVYQSDEEMTAISCGNLGGARFGDELAVGLGEAGVPGHTGIAVLEEDPEKAGETMVTVYIGHAMSPVSMGGGADDGHGHDAKDDGHAGGETPDDGHGHDDGDHADDAAATPSA